MLELHDIAFRLDLHATGIRSKKVQDLLLSGAKEAEFAEAAGDAATRAYHLASLSVFIKAALLNMGYTGNNMSYVEPLARMLIAVEDMISAEPEARNTLVDVVLGTREAGWAVEAFVHLDHRVGRGVDLRHRSRGETADPGSSC